MPTRLPDHTTTRRQPVDVTRRTFLRLFLPVRFNALPVDVALWLRCSLAGPQLRPG